MRRKPILNNRQKQYSLYFHSISEVLVLALALKIGKLFICEFSGLSRFFSYLFFFPVSHLGGISGHIRALNILNDWFRFI